MTVPPGDPQEGQSADAGLSLGQRVLLNTGALAGSSLWRIGVSFLLQLLIARVLGVQELGIYTVALAYLNVGQVVSELGLPALLSRDLAYLRLQRRAYFHLALRVQFVAALVAWTVLTLLALVLPYSPAARWSLVLIGASLPLYAITSSCETLFRAAERMELVMGVETFINLLILVGSVFLLMTGTTIYYLIGVLVITQGISAGVCVLILRKTNIFPAPQHEIDIDMGALWRPMRPFFSLSIAEVLQQRLDILLLSIVVGPALTGIYSAAYNLVRILVKLIQNYWQALYPTLSRTFSEVDPRFQKLSDLSLRYGLLTLLPVAALVFGTADEVTRLIYGVEFTASGSVLRLLVWTTPVILTETFVVTQMMVRRQPQKSVLVIGVYLASLLITLPILASSYGADGAAWASLLAACAGTLTGLAILHRQKIAVAVNRLGWTIAAAVVTAVLTTLIPAPWLLSAAVGAVVYVAIVWTSGVISSADLELIRHTIRPNNR